ncbi:MAG: acyl--CoA ligase [Sphingosinicella sp.]|nr:acyl--CoA ligase [Sphingosinicella sp.]
MSTETLVDRIYRFQQERPDAPALRDPNHSLSWGELGRLSNRIANALVAAGLAKGDRIALLAPGSALYAATMVGALKAGVSVVPLPTLLSGEAITAMIADSGARILFAADPLRPLAGSAAPRTVSLEIPDIEAFVASIPDTRPSVSVDIEDEFNVIYSSGTTGHPKGIVQSHRLRAAAALRFGAVGFPDGCRTLATTALYSNWTMGALIYTLWSGGCIHIGGKFTPQGFLDLCAAFRPHDIFMVPVQVKRLLDHVAAANAAPPPAARKWCAGSYFPSEQKRALLDFWPGGLMEIYGLTEGAPFTMLDAAAYPDRIGTVGRAEPPGDVKIINDDGRELPTGARGEVLGRVRIVMRGYNNSPVATEALIWRDANGDAWFRSGDIGELDEDGFLTITGRKKDMIISGGFNIYAADLEETLLRHPAVAEAAVFAVPSAQWGESPVAAIVAGSDAVAETGDILAWANTQLGSLQRLRDLVVVETLPRGSLDKILYRALREQFRHLGDMEAPKP